MKALLMIIAIMLELFDMHAANLVKNGSFEKCSNDGMPLNWKMFTSKKAQGKVVLTKEYASDGKSSVCIEKINDMAGNVGIRQKIKLKPNTKYVFRIKGIRKVGNRWHYYKLWIVPDKKVLGVGRFKHKLQGSKLEASTSGAIKFKTGNSSKNVLDIAIAVWGAKDNDKSSIGKLWIDEVELKEVETKPIELQGLALNYFSDDTITFKLNVYSKFHVPRGAVNIQIINMNGKKLLNKEYRLKLGENNIKLNLKTAPQGKYKILVKTCSEENKNKILINRNFNINSIIKER